ncbi:putative S-glutathione synthase [Peziza echinospora]|nr:putative S-glutathione synthase [Peziza echinospora]
MSTEPETKLYHGSCHCGSLKYTLQLPVDLSNLKHSKCNCTLCHKTNFHAARIPDIKTFAEDPSNDPSARGDYTFDRKSMHHIFCKNCGVRTWAYGFVPEIGGDHVVVNMFTIDGADLSGLPCKTYYDGRSGKWTVTETPTAPGGY